MFLYSQHKKEFWISGIIILLVVGYWQRRNIAKTLKIPLYLALDPMSTVRYYQLNQAFRPYVASLIDQADLLGYDSTIVSGYRNYQDGVKLAQQLGEAAAPITNYHLFGLAVDMNFTSRATGKVLNKATSTLADWNTSGIPILADNLGIRWGGTFSTPDINHFDLASVYPILDLTNLAIDQYGSLQNVNGTDLKIA